MATMSMGKVKERDLMIVSSTSSRVKVVGTWSEFAVAGMAILMMMCLRWRAP
jgi:hypothetical protein